jgi:two-component sensor histidine kinase
MAESRIIIKPQDHCEGLLEGLGLDNVLRIKRGNTEMPGVEMEPLPEFAAIQTERMLLIRRAHENLVRIDKRNEQKFGSFLRQLAKEMSQLL